MHEIGNLFSGGAKKVKKPDPAPAPTVMPVAPEADDVAVEAEKRRRARELQNRSGRDSTILSDAMETLGG